VLSKLNISSPRWTPDRFQAAIALNVSQSAVTTALQQLEVQLGVSLETGDFSATKLFREFLSLNFSGAAH
jgi:hypothetical protein